MSATNAMKANFKPYDGPKPYLFVNYSHRDNKQVIPILNALNCAGYAICYDKGIAGGKKWRDWIADRVSRCEGFLAFISPVSAASHHCEVEIDHAIDNNRYIVPIYLKRNVRLPKGIEMYLHGTQRINYDGDPNGLVKELKDIQELEPTRHFPSPPPPTPPQLPERKRMVAYFLAVCAALAALALIVAVALTLPRFGQPQGSFDGGVLIVSRGTMLTGELPDYSDPFSDTRDNNLPPWLDEKDGIQIAYIDNGISNVCQGMFVYCINLEEVHILGKITSIGDYAFYGCKKLPGIAIPPGVTSIGDYAFFMCESMDSVDIPEGVTSIGEGAFSHCDSLKSVTIPDSVVNIGLNAFGECPKLVDASVPASLNTEGVFGQGTTVTRRMPTM